jgi:Dolichyl-phosphate-mannose-protein mannosyltransferase
MSADAIETRPNIARSLSGLRARPEVLVALLTIAVLIVRITQLHQSLFGDEVLAYNEIVGHSLSTVINTVNTGSESSPPLFFILAWLTSKLGDPSVLIRLPTLIGAAIFAIGPFNAYYGIEARPYATLAFFVAVSTYALLRAVRTNRIGWWLLYSLAATAAAYTHYTAVFVLLVQGVWSLWVCRRRPREPLLAAALGVLLYLPWLGHVHGKALNVYGQLVPFTFHQVVSDLPRPLTGYPYASITRIPTDPGLAIVMCAAALGLWRLAPRLRAVAATELHSDRGHPPTRLLIAVLAIATPIGLFLYSLLGTDLWIARSQIASLPAQALALGGLLAAIGGIEGAIAIVAVLATLTFGTVRALSPAYRRPPFRVAAQYLDRVAAPNDPVIFYPSFLYLDSAIAVQFQRRHLTRKASQTQWAGIPPGEEAFVVLDDAIASALHIGTPHPPGFRLVASEHYTGLDPFRVITYQRLG